MDRFQLKRPQASSISSSAELSVSQLELQNLQVISFTLLVERCFTVLPMLWPSTKSLYLHILPRYCLDFSKFHIDTAMIFPIFAVILPQYLVLLLVAVPQFLPFRPSQIISSGQK
jgi:hypothetical protein